MSFPKPSHEPSNSSPSTTNANANTNPNSCPFYSVLSVHVTLISALNTYHEPRYVLEIN